MKKTETSKRTRPAAHTGGGHILTKDVLKRIETLGYADIIVGVPSFRNEKTIKKVVSAACHGMKRYFPGMRPVFVNSDGGSTDNTREVVLRTKVPAGVEKIVTPYVGIPGKGTAFRTIFEIADRLDAKLLIVLDSDLRSVTPEWIKLMGEPIVKYNYGYVVPVYRRHKYDGTITNSIAYPLTRTLYGQNIRQPIAGDFGISGALNKYYSHQNIYEDAEIARFGIDIFMTTTAICEGFRICQAHTGAKIHDPKDPGSDLYGMFSQVVGTIFKLMRKYDMKWEALDTVRDAEFYGTDLGAEAPPVSVNFLSLVKKFLAGHKEEEPLLRAVLSKEHFVMVDAIFQALESAVREGRGVEAAAVNAVFRWPRIVYDFALAYNFSGLSVGDVIKAMVPLYYFKTARFIAASKSFDHQEAERLIYLEALDFEIERHYLCEQWKRRKRAASRLF